jgi:hypothetical protein
MFTFLPYNANTRLTSCEYAPCFALQKNAWGGGKTLFVSDLRQNCALFRATAKDFCNRYTYCLVRGRFFLCFFRNLKKQHYYEDYQ